MTAAAEPQQTEVALALVDGRAVLVLRSPGSGSLGVSMSPREADHLAGRLRKAASDLRAAEARKARPCA